MHFSRPLEPSMPERSDEAISIADRLRHIALVRHAPVTALFILLAVCVVCLGFILVDLAALLAIVPLLIVLWASFARSRIQ